MNVNAATRLFVMFCSIAGTPHVVADESNRISDSQLVGKWMGHRHFFEYFRDHTFAYDDNRNPGMKWRLDGRRVILFFPDMPPGETNSAYSAGTVMNTIISLSKDKLVGLNKDGYRFIEYRIVHDTPEARDDAATRAKAEQGRLTKR